MKRLFILVALVGLVLGACGGDDDTTSTTAGGSGEGSGETGAVEIANFAFEPDSLSVPVGATVSWENSDNVAHTATSDDQVFSSGSIEGGGTFSFTFEEAGTFTYFCSIHPTMTGTIVVE